MDDTSHPMLPSSFNIADYLRKFPHGGNSRFVETKLEFTVKNLDGPIGVTQLPTSSNIVVGVTGRNEVRIYDQEGGFVSTVKPGRPFKRPSDMVALPDGRFAVRDDLGIQLFDEDGNFMRVFAEGKLGRAFGLATDCQGHLITINTNAFGNPPENLTAKGQSDIIMINIESGEIVRRIELEDVIIDKTRSKCRFLQCDGKRLYIVDLGLDKVYVLSLTKTVARMFGYTGKGQGQFSDPAGLCVDAHGNTIVADSRNHRLQIFDKKREYLGHVHVKEGLKRPSGIFLDPFEASLYILNLWGNSMCKYKLVK